MHVALTTTLCILLGLGFIASTVLWGFNSRFWNQDVSVNTDQQKRGTELAVIGFVLATFFFISFLLVLSAGNSSGHIVPSFPQGKKGKN
jgi:hypothetical protein